VESESGHGNAPHVTALRLGSFVDSLCMEPVANLDELRLRATKFMKLKALREFRN